jgi:hypothetical protein
VLQSVGLLQGSARVSFFDSTLLLPLDNVALWQGLDFAREYIDREAAFAAVADRLMPSFDLIDCGANLGVTAAQFARCSKNLRKIVAIELN